MSFEEYDEFEVTEEIPEIEVDYDASYDFESNIPLADDIQDAVTFDVNSIDYSSADPNDIKEVHIAMQILSHLKTQDKSIIEELYYMQLMENFGIEEEDPTELTR